MKETRVQATRKRVGQIQTEAIPMLLSIFHWAYLLQNAEFTFCVSKAMAVALENPNTH